MAIVRTGLTMMLLATVPFSAVSQDTESAETAPPPPPPTSTESAPQPPDTRSLSEIFIPSEEIAADEEIVFPVNI